MIGMLSKKPKRLLRFAHCFSVPSEIDSAIAGTLTIMSAGRPISICAMSSHLQRVDTVIALLREAHRYSSGTRPFVPVDDQQLLGANRSRGKVISGIPRKGYRTS